VSHISPVHLQRMLNRRRNPTGSTAFLTSAVPGVQAWVVFGLADDPDFGCLFVHHPDSVHLPTVVKFHAHIIASGGRISKNCLAPNTAFPDELTVLLVLES